TAGYARSMVDGRLARARVGCARRWLAYGAHANAAPDSGNDGCVRRIRCGAWRPEPRDRLVEPPGVASARAGVERVSRACARTDLRCAALVGEHRDRVCEDGP